MAIGNRLFVWLWLAASCAAPNLGHERASLGNTQHVTFMHAGFGAGPVAFTDAAGVLVEERRYEPFGTPIDAHIRTDVGDVIGAPDLVSRDVNPLNKRTEATTGWSDHGARWLAPETARWLTPDPPVAGPSARFMAAPWALHPYQYVDQNPVAYWDPDGRQGEAVLTVGEFWGSANASARQLAASGRHGQLAAAGLLIGAAIAIPIVAVAPALSEHINGGEDPTFTELHHWVQARSRMVDARPFIKRAIDRAKAVSAAQTKTPDEPELFIMALNESSPNWDNTPLALDHPPYGRAIPAPKPITSVDVAAMIDVQLASYSFHLERRGIDSTPLVHAGNDLKRQVRAVENDRGVWEDGKEVARVRLRFPPPLSPIDLTIENVRGFNLRPPNNRDFN